MTPEDLLEIWKIEQLKYRYLRCVDLKLWDELEGLFVPEARAQYGGGAYRFDDRSSIMQFLRATMSSDRVLSSHKCHHPEITLDPNGVAATGIWALDDVVIQQEVGMTIRGAAYYEDSYVKVGESWLIESTGYRRVYEELYPRTSIEGLRISAEYWATEGRSKIGGRDLPPGARTQRDRGPEQKASAGAEGAEQSHG